MPTAEGLLLEIADNGVCTITLSRPEKKNALTFDIYGDLTRIFRELQDDDRVKTVLLCGEGRAFCSGGDVHEIIGPLFEKDAKGLWEFTRMTCDLIENMRALSKPIIACIEGVAAGAGAVIALASDIRVGSPRARFGFLFVRVGLCGADMGAAYLLPRVIGLGRATELLMTGDLVDAEEAYRMGLLNHIYSEESTREEARNLADRLAAGPTFALAMTKRALNEEMGMDLRAALESEARTQAFCMETEDFRVAYEAFVAKEKPEFKGR
jgi:enoyl-CoA hydratase/carnithine racemase